jgi:hypothetical protein
MRLRYRAALWVFNHRSRFWGWFWVVVSIISIGAELGRPWEDGTAGPAQTNNVIEAVVRKMFPSIGIFISDLSTYDCRLSSAGKADDIVGVKPFRVITKTNECVWSYGPLVGSFHYFRCCVGKRRTATSGYYIIDELLDLEGWRSSGIPHLDVYMGDGARAIVIEIPGMNTYPSPLFVSERFLGLPDIFFGTICQAGEFSNRLGSFFSDLIGARGKTFSGGGISTGSISNLLSSTGLRLRRFDEFRCLSRPFPRTPFHNAYLDDGGSSIEESSKAIKKLLATNALLATVVFFHLSKRFIFASWG